MGRAYVEKEALPYTTYKANEETEKFYEMLRRVGDDFFVDGGMNLGSEEIKAMILEKVFKGVET